MLPVEHYVYNKYSSHPTLKYTGDVSVWTKLVLVIRLLTKNLE